MTNFGDRKTCVVVVLEIRQIAVHHRLLAEHGEDLLLTDQVVHQLGQGIGEFWTRREYLSVHRIVHWGMKDSRWRKSW